MTTMLLALMLVGDWNDVLRIPSDQKIQLSTRDGASVNAQFVSASPDTVVIREKAGQRSISRVDVRRLAVADPSRRARNGIISTAVGIAAGAAIGFAICPYCPNEGNGSKYLGPAIAAGAGIGALGFLPTPYRLLYRSK